MPTPHLDGKHVVFGEVLNGKNIIRKIENLPTQSDKPVQEVKIGDCGQLTGQDFSAATSKAADATGDPYEDFPDDQGTDLKGTEYFKIASDLKDYGNKAFKAGDLETGIEKYQKGLRYLNEYPQANESDPAELEADMKQLRYTLHNNSALLANKSKRYDDGEKWATFAIEAIPTNAKDVDKAKAYHRRGTARVALRDEEDGKNDLETAAKLAPGDAAIAKELTSVKKSLAEKVKKEKAAYQKFFK